MTELQLRSALGVSTLILPAPGATISVVDRALMLWVYFLETITPACRIFAIGMDVRIFAIDYEHRVLAVRCDHV